MLAPERAEIVVAVKLIDGRYRITYVDPLVAEVRRGGSVNWTLKVPADMTVRIENFRLKVTDTPFNEPWTPDSRSATVRSARSLTYKYDIVLGNGERLDPEIVIYEDA